MSVAAILPILLILLGLLSAVGGLALLRARWRAAAALARAEAAERDAAAAARSLGLVAAELRGPGLEVLGRAERLLRDAAGAAAAASAGGVSAGEAAELAESVGAVARNLLRLAEQIAELVRLQSGPPALWEETFPLGPLLEEAIAAVATLPGAEGRRWRVAPELAGLSLHGDRRALRGAVQQVLTRAAGLSRAGDWIELRLDPACGQCFAILIEDEGSGVPSEDLAPGAVAGCGAEATGTRGVGLGLAIARALLQAHGGGLVLEAVPGIGARASLLLPRSRIAGAVAAGCDPAAGGGVVQARNASG